MSNRKSSPPGSGVDSTTWSDHTDIRPTLMVLLGLKDDYGHDGRALTEDLSGWARPAATKKSNGYITVAQMYKQINAAVGKFGLATLQASTRAIESGSASDDSTYTSLENQLAALTHDRDTLAHQMIALLEGAEFDGNAIDQRTAQALVAQGQALIARANALAQ
ncbi:MAG: hypothetical protein E6J40_13070 [Chloroflexi bacterium]|nr:MAG: hypothetical protein E6J40_13070 [Chloroflexota bacterium]